MKKKHRAFLKWAGGKYALTDVINSMLPKGNRLIEPFVGAGSVFLNSDYDEYLLNDINQDLINLYRIVQRTPDKFIADARRLFSPENNQADSYYQLRKDFNASSDPYFRSLVFLYMNRHGYNGLCRYNKSGGYNVPFGQYKRPYFPEAELHYFAEKAAKAVFICDGYRQTFAHAKSGDIIYCDPPYVPLSKTASFTSYSGNGFGLDEQADLANAVEEVTKNRKISVLISNHDTIWTRKIYQHAKKHHSIEVSRTISQKGNARNKVFELLALY
ncbi:Dam family site-specific DNA-(adenine-N6)-methyltransferase [Colwellia sp. MB02u-10]|jgi:DNA adenine methylase|uniref:Dam family site-specific DNA-(adenine-N6)-methyltransferase n=1 Tax=Colwellia sp. MB02u-10 TaxID=2759828 RepID=UPI0015F62538|nr:Dam family site-specific DNA-(adenine-N6)-methyltransferase [Colwellia sp. MB02u-10]MBA6340668.1 Dam family site-specific DNA-(adenine-N6)-methyltransferase [Colwellia sp. MB02u-10]